MKLEKCLYGLLLILLLLFCLGSIKPLYESEALHGWREESNKPAFSFAAVTEGSYQQAFEPYFNDRSGFRNDLVRLRNQLHYSLFNVVVNDKIISGKEGVLYETGYIYNAIYGLYTGDRQHFIDKSAKLARIKDTLEAQGKEFLYVAAPGKGTLYPEYIPNYLLHSRMNIPPQEAYLRQFDSLGIEYIDLNRYFIERRKTDSTWLYSRYGIHYNKYGAYLAVDTLCKYFDKRYPFMPRLVLDSISADYMPWDAEHDCRMSCNLFADEPRELLYHPHIHYEKRGEKGLNCLFVGDSYIFPLWLLNMHKEYFSSSQHWYYFNEVHYSDGREKSSVDKIDILKELEATDVVIVLFTNATTLDQDNGFVDKVYELYFGNEK